MTDYQTDIFGNMIPVEDALSQKSRETIKSRFRKMYGYDDSHRCKDCKYLCIYYAGNSKYYKCNLMGISASEATDIRLKDPACTRWEQGPGRND